MAVKSPPKKGSAKPPSGGKAGLKSMSDLWGATPTPENQFGDIPDGKYRAKINEALVETGGKNKDRLQVKWAFRITGPTHENRMCWMNTGLNDQQGIEFTKRALATLGAEVPNDIEELPDLLSSLKDKSVEINLKTRTTDSGTYQNTYINKAIDEGDEGPGSEGEETTVSFVGQKVEFNTDDGVIQGKVTKQDGDKLTVKDSNSDAWEVEVSDVTVLNEGEGAETPAEETEQTETAEESQAETSEWLGKNAAFKDDKGKTIVGKVKADDGEGNLTIEIGDEEWSVPTSEVFEPPKAATKTTPAKPIQKKSIKRVGKK